MDYPAFFTVAEVAEKLGISKYQVYRRISRGHLRPSPFRRQHSQILIAEKDVNDYVAAGGPAVLSPPKRPPSNWLSTREVAELTGYPPEVIREMCRNGTLEYRKGVGPRAQYRISRYSANRLKERGQ